MSIEVGAPQIQAVDLETRIKTSLINFCFQSQYKSKINTKFCYKLDKTATETCEMSKQVYVE